MVSFKIFRRKGSAMSSILNVLGMAVAFAAFYIILVQVDYDLNFNKSIKDSERIFSITSGGMEGSGKRQMYFCRPLAEIILEASPNIECGGAMDICNTEYNRYWIEKAGARQEIQLAVNTFSGDALTLFGFEAVEGSLDDIIDEASLAVSETIAKRFGLQVGMTLGYESDSIKTIKAIFKDMPENSHLRDIQVLRNLGDDGLDNFSEWGYNYFVKLYDPSQAKNMARELSPVTAKFLQEKYFSALPSAEDMGMTQEVYDEVISRFIKSAEVEFMPLENLYFTDNLSNEIEHGSKTTTAVLIIVIILIVGIAFINYINFFFAQIPERIRSVNTKKVLGCTRRELVIGTIKESVTLILIALILAFVIVTLFNISQLTHLLSADSSLIANFGLTLLTVVIAVTISVVSSLYPAFYITSFEPALVLKGSFSGTKEGQRLRYILIGIQFIISIVLIICSGFINLQRSYMVNYDMGFDKEQLLYVHTTEYIGRNAVAVEMQLKSDPQILDVTWAAGNLLATTRMGWGREWNGTVINFQCYPVAPDFPEFMGFEILEGRTFRKEDEYNPNGTFIFNEAAKRQYGFNLEDKISSHSDQMLK